MRSALGSCPAGKKGRTEGPDRITSDRTGPGRCWAAVAGRGTGDRWLAGGDLSPVAEREAVGVGCRVFCRCSGRRYQSRVFHQPGALQCLVQPGKEWFLSRELYERSMDFRHLTLCGSDTWQLTETSAINCESAANWLGWVVFLDKQVMSILKAES